MKNIKHIFNGMALAACLISVIDQIIYCNIPATLGWIVAFMYCGINIINTIDK